MIDISPGAMATTASILRVTTETTSTYTMDMATQPGTGQPYAPNVVKRGDFARIWQSSGLMAPIPKPHPATGMFWPITWQTIHCS
jgi:hypothetical protein